MTPSDSAAASRCALLAVAAVLLVVHGGCYRKAADPSSFYSPYTGNDPLTIRGVSPGQSEEAVVALLGPPDRRNDAGYQTESIQWQRFPDMVVTFDLRTRRVTDVLGNQLDAGGESVVSSGMSEADVRAVLGKPAASKGRYQPAGSGVISIGMKRAGGTLTYRRDGSDVEITENDGAVAYIRLRSAAP